MYSRGSTSTLHIWIATNQPTPQVFFIYDAYMMTWIISTTEGISEVVNIHLYFLMNPDDWITCNFVTSGVTFRFTHTAKRGMNYTRGVLPMWTASLSCSEQWIFMVTRCYTIYSIHTGSQTARCFKEILITGSVSEVSQNIQVCFFFSKFVLYFL